MIVMPLIIMGILLVFGGFASFFLPETKNKSLPQTIHESDAISLVNPFSIFQRKRHQQKTDGKITICDVCKLGMKNSSKVV